MEDEEEEAKEDEVTSDGVQEDPVQSACEAAAGLSCFSEGSCEQFLDEVVTYGEFVGEEALGVLGSIYFGSLGEQLKLLRGEEELPGKVAVGGADGCGSWLDPGVHASGNFEEGLCFGGDSILDGRFQFGETFVFEGAYSYYGELELLAELAQVDLKGFAVQEIDHVHGDEGGEAEVCDLGSQE